MYSFDEQLKLGKQGELIIDYYLSHYYDLRAASRAEQRLGIDSVLTSHAGKVVKLEYKTDFMSQKTGNIVIETISVDTRNKPGWGLTSKSDIIIFYLYHLHRLFFIKTSLIKDNIAQWQQDYRTVKIRNKDYHTHGVLVPVVVLENIAWRIVDNVNPEFVKAAILSKNRT